VLQLGHQSRVILLKSIATKVVFAHFSFFDAIHTCIVSGNTSRGNI